jgi:hypothetical protein
MELYTKFMTCSSWNINDRILQNKINTEHILKHKEQLNKTEILILMASLLSVPVVSHLVCRKYFRIELHFLKFESNEKWNVKKL